MECVLLLEHYLNKAWLQAPFSRLINALPTFHFAIRCATLSSVALRVYCLDRAMDYDKVTIPSRTSRHGAGVIEKVDTSHSARIAAFSSSRQAKSSSSSASSSSSSALTVSGRRTRVAPKYYDDNGDDDDDNALNSRKSRNSRKRKNEEEEDDDEEEEEEEEEDDSEDGVDMATTWACPLCTTENETRARSCGSCGERKPAVGLVSSSAGKNGSRERSSGSRTGGGRSRSRGYDEEEEEDVQSRAARQSGRKRTKVSYRDDGSDIDEDDDGNGRGDSGRGSRGREIGSSSRGTVGNSTAVEVSTKPVIDFDVEIALAKQRWINDQASNPNGPDTLAQEITVRLLSVLRHLYFNPKTDIFWAPVDHRIYTNYKQFVKEPMDLGTLTHQVKIGYFGQDHQQFAKVVNENDFVDFIQFDLSLSLYDLFMYVYIFVYRRFFLPYLCWNYRTLFLNQYYLYFAYAILQVKYMAV